MSSGRGQCFHDRVRRGRGHEGGEGEEGEPRRRERGVEHLADDVGVGAQDDDDDREDREQVGGGLEPDGGQSPRSRR